MFFFEFWHQMAILLYFGYMPPGFQQSHQDFPKHVEIARTKPLLNRMNPHRYWGSAGANSTSTGLSFPEALSPKVTRCAMGTPSSDRKKKPGTLTAGSYKSRVFVKENDRSTIHLHEDMMFQPGKSSGVFFFTMGEKKN